MTAEPKYEEVEGEALVYPSGHSPIYGWCAAHDQWRKIRVDNSGALVMSQNGEDTQSEVADPTTSDQTLFTGAGWVFGVVNSTASILTIKDGAVAKMLVLPGTVLNIPVRISTSAVYSVASAPLGAKVAFSWRADL